MLSLNSKTEIKKEVRVDQSKAVIAIGLSVVAILLSVILFLNRDSSQNLDLKIESEYQAVFLENGQVYFGKIDKGSSDLNFIVLKNVYYLSNQSESTSSDINLIKLGDELHGPSNRMDINLSKVLFIEDLSPSSKVLSAIRDAE